MTLAGSYTKGQLTVHHDPAVITSVSKALRGVGKQVALVPTMGALHAGHLQLVRQAKLTGAVVIVSIFVNPLQFGVGEDLDAYPRTLDADVALLREEGVELVFAPSASSLDSPRRTPSPHPLASLASPRRSPATRHSLSRAVPAPPKMPSSTRGTTPCSSPKARRRSHSCPRRCTAA